MVQEGDSRPLDRFRRQQPPALRPLPTRRSPGISRVRPEPVGRLPSLRRRILGRPCQSVVTPQPPPAQHCQVRALGRLQARTRHRPSRSDDLRSARAQLSPAPGTSPRADLLVNLTRRSFLATPLALAAQGSLNRRAIVSRHNPTLKAFDPRSPLTVGNGEFCFTVDCTGLQTFPSLYEKDLTLSTMSQRGWETSPNRPPGELRMTEYDTYGRKVGYPTSSTGQA